MRTRNLFGGLLTAAAAGLILCALPGSAHAIDFGVGVGISVKGGVQFGGTDEPDKEVYDGQAVPGVVYPGWFGVGYGIGGFIEGRLFDLFGLELGFTYEESSGEGDLNDQPITLTTQDLIVSLHARIATPGFVKFVFGIGPDFVVPLGAGVETDIPFDFQARERNLTTALGVALGAEIDAVFVRVPIELRFRYTPMGDNYDDRFAEMPTPNRHVYRNNWNYQGMVMVGLQYYLDVWSLL